MKTTKNVNIKSFLKSATVTGLAALTALTSLGMGSMNVFADDVKLPTYVFNGTNAERAISDYFVNGFTAMGENTVVIPHMDILDTKDNGSTFDVYGDFYVLEYDKQGNTFAATQTAPESAGRFTLAKNNDGTFTVASYQSVPANADKDAFKEVFGKNLGEEAYDVYKEDLNSDLWNTIRAEDIGYYSYDNNLGLGKIEVDENHSIDVANVSFSAKSSRTMYVQEDANVRSAGSKLATAFDGLGRGEDIVVTGMANGWGRVTMNGRTGYISSSLLGDSKPAKQEKKKEDVEISSTSGKIEYYDGDKVTVNGVTAYVTEDTNLEGYLVVGNTADLKWKKVGNDRREALLLRASWDYDEKKSDDGYVVVEIPDEDEESDEVMVDIPDEDENDGSADQAETYDEDVVVDIED
ncbi:MAG: hypothetical protein Q4A32_07450 [Lachnospiraceae bacterium]|nr:hypothetical protein [Lachnospiraceae bacterium]